MAFSIFLENPIDYTRIFVSHHTFLFTVMSVAFCFGGKYRNTGGYLLNILQERDAKLNQSKNKGEMSNNMVDCLKEFLLKHPEIRYLSGQAESTPEGNSLQPDSLASKKFPTFDPTAIEADRTFLELILFKAVLQNGRKAEDHNQLLAEVFEDDPSMFERSSLSPE